MAKKACWPNSRGQTKEILGNTVYMGKAFDLIHGYGWHCQVFGNRYGVGYGFHKSNRFTAYRIAVLDAEKARTRLMGV